MCELSPRLRRAEPPAMSTAALAAELGAVAAPAPSEKSWTRYLTERKSVVRMAAPYSPRPRTSSPRCRHPVAPNERGNHCARQGYRMTGHFRSWLGRTTPTLIHLCISLWSYRRAKLLPQPKRKSDKGSASSRRASAPSSAAGERKRAASASLTRAISRPRSDLGANGQPAAGTANGA
jgi:hypothetical protein